MNNFLSQLSTVVKLNSLYSFLKMFNLVAKLSHQNQIVKCHHKLGNSEYSILFFIDILIFLSQYFGNFIFELLIY